MEVWTVLERPDLDPVLALKAYLNLRKERFSESEALPVFLHENGKIFAKDEFNRDLSALLATYPQLNTQRDKWSGHSLRSGISTLLSQLGFSSDEIKSWGRWASDAYLRYVKDTSQRRAVRAQMTETFHNMLSGV